MAAIRKSTTSNPEKPTAGAAVVLGVFSSSMVRDLILGTLLKIYAKYELEQSSLPTNKSGKRRCLSVLVIKTSYSIAGNRRI